MALIVAAGQRGMGADDICAQAVGLLMSSRPGSWVSRENRDGAAHEIDNALAALSVSKKQAAKSH